MGGGRSRRRRRRGERRRRENRGAKSAEGGGVWGGGVHSRIAALYYRPTLNTEYNESFWLETLARVSPPHRGKGSGEGAMPSRNTSSVFDKSTSESVAHELH